MSCVKEHSNRDGKLDRKKKTPYILRILDKWPPLTGWPTLYFVLTVFTVEPSQTNARLRRKCAARQRTTPCERSPRCRCGRSGAGYQDWDITTGAAIPTSLESPYLRLLRSLPVLNRTAVSGGAVEGCRSTCCDNLCVPAACIRSSSSTSHRHHSGKTNRRPRRRTQDG